MGYRLSLPGVAGLIVAIGFTADSFIVYFERIRDELRDGRTLPAVERGWDRARRTILAAKAVNLISAVILYFLAVGGVRGFAFTLGLTTIIDVAGRLLVHAPGDGGHHQDPVLPRRPPRSGLARAASGSGPRYVGAGECRARHRRQVATTRTRPPIDAPSGRGAVPVAGRRRRPGPDDRRSAAAAVPPRRRRPTTDAPATHRRRRRARDRAHRGEA